jgi:SNF2 family DNA or RNA helicase
LKAKVNLKENNFSIIFDQRPPNKIMFQLKYFNLNKEESEEKIKYSSVIDLINMEKIVNFLEKNKIQYILNNELDDYLSNIKAEREQFRNKANLISKIKNKESKDELNNFNKTINFLDRNLVDHQIHSLFHLYSAGSAANFSVPGSGKTSVVLAYFEKLRLENKVDAIFVIGPKNAFGSWEFEFYKNFNHKPKMKILGPDPGDRQIFYEKVLTSNLILSHFQTVTRDIDLLKNFFSRNKILLVIDEAHYIKKIEGTWSSAILELSSCSKFKVVLTGTPVPNDLRDIFNYLDFLYGQDKVLTSEDKSRVEILLNKKNNEEAIEFVSQRINPYFVRVTKNDLNLAKQIINPPILLDMNTYEKQIYDAIVTNIKDYGRKEFFDNADLIEQICKARIIRLKQCASYVKNLESILEDNPVFPKENLITNNISEIIARYDELEKPAKLLKLLDKVKNLKVKNKKVLIWSTHRKTVDLIHKELTFNNINVEKIIGPTDLDQRKNIKINFNDKESSLDAIVATPQSCAESISLHQACTNAIYYDLSYNAAEFLQSLDRIHRVGGSEVNPVEYDFLHYNDSVDIKVYNKVFQKADRQMRIIEEENFTFDLNDEDESWEELYNDLEL